MNRFLFILLFTLSISHAQSIFRSDEHVLFQEAKSGQSILILQDSLLYKGKLIQPKQFKHGNYLENLKYYIPFVANNKNYLAYNGCGCVLEWRNDSIVRIDNSFLHKNQFGAATFVYHDKIYFWGGYGLFTHKNILTQFNFKTKEWDEVETFGVPPSPRRQAHGIVIDNYFYVFSGYEKDDKNFLQIKPCEPSVWKLYLPTMQWSAIGNYDPTTNLNSKEGIAASFVVNKKLYILPLMEYNNIYEIDFLKNTLTTYKGYTKNVTQPYFDTRTNEVVYLNKNADGLKNLIRTPLKEFLGKPINRQDFILPWYRTIKLSTLFIILFSLLGSYILVSYFKKRRRNFTPFTGIVYYSTKEVFFYRGKHLDTLEDAELRTLVYLVQNRNDYRSLNELNHLFENEIQSDNFTTVVKRRETALSNLIAKLVFITEKSEEDILIYRKNPNDKRVKEIKLKEDFIKIK